MKRKLSSLLCAVAMLASGIFHVQSAALESAKSAAISKDLEARIARVENGLLTPIVIKGEPIKGMPIAERMKHYNVPGVSIAVIDNFTVSWARGYGLMEAGTDKKVTPETLFQAASISKPVAAMAALHLVEKGKLSLDEDVNQKLVSWKVPENEFTREKKVTLRGLVSHSAGLTVHGFPGYAADKSIPSVKQILDGEQPANTKAIRVDIVPGTKWRYSGGGYTVMQQLVIDVTGKPFPDVMEQLVLKKLGMNHSTYEQPLPQKRQNSASSAHRRDGSKITGDWHAYPEMAAAGLWTTPTDLARFAVEIQKSFAGKSNRVISKEMTHQMLTRQSGNSGLGIGVAGEGATLNFSHGGANEGFRCYLVAYAETGKGAVVMTNADNGSELMTEIIRGIAREYDWPDYKLRERAAVKLSPEMLKSYAGEYQVSQGFSVTIATENGRLFGLPKGEPRVELFAESEMKFFSVESPLEVTFTKDAEGKVTDITIRLFNRELKGKKTK